MIYDKIENYECYAVLGPRFEAALKFLADNRGGELETGRYDIIPGEVYANVREYDVSESDVSRPEAHKKYADVQYVFSGAEFLGVGFADELVIEQEYDAEKDVAF